MRVSVPAADASKRLWPTRPTLRSLDEEGIAASRDVLDLTRINPFNDVSDRVSRFPHNEWTVAQGRIRKAYSYTSALRI